MQTFNSWQNTIPEWRLSFLRNRIAELELSGQSYPMIHSYFKQFEALYLYPTTMPGPIGEENLLFCLNRGKALITKDISENKIWFIQVIVALLTGNEVYCDASSDIVESLQQELKQAGFHSALHLISSEAWHDMLADKSISIVSVVKSRDQIQSIALELAKKHCMIPQFIYEVEHEALQYMIRPDYLMYWMHEKTQTVNTTAVGGNAKLLDSI